MAAAKDVDPPLRGRIGNREEGHPVLRRIDGEARQHGDTDACAHHGEQRGGVAHHQLRALEDLLKLLVGDVSADAVTDAGIYGRRSLPTGVGAGEGAIAASQGRRPYSAFGSILADVETAVGGEALGRPLTAMWPNAQR